MGQDYGDGYTSYEDDDDSYALGSEDSYRADRDSAPPRNSEPYMTVDINEPRVECGDRVTGRVRWSGPKNARSARVTLQYRTEGRGNTNKDDVDTLELPGGYAGDHHFELLVPADGPMSYAGNLIAVIWEVELQLDLKGRRDPKAEELIHIMPQRI